MRAPFAFLALTLTLLPALTGCGGSTTSPTAPTITTTTTAPSTPSPPAASPAPTSAMATAIADLTNAERAKAGLATLRVSAALNVAAQLQADQLASLQVFGHEVPDGRYPTPPDRLAAAGYPWLRYGENLALGYATAAEATVGWMNSEGHRANILNPFFTEIGTAFATDSRSQPYYVEVFGTPR